MTNYGYMCKVDYDYHLESDYYGVTIYPSEKSLKDNLECTDECGIIKVEVKYSETIQ